LIHTIAFAPYEFISRSNEVFSGQAPVRLTPQIANQINETDGTMLASSRGKYDLTGYRS
jgi:hypothetical protein